MTEGPLTTTEDLEYPFIETEAESIDTYLVRGIAIESGSSVNGGVFNSGTIAPEFGAGWSIYEQYSVSDGNLYFNTAKCAKDKDGFYTGLVYDHMNTSNEAPYADENIGISFGGVGVLQAQDYKFFVGGRCLAPEPVLTAIGVTGICEMFCDEFDGVDNAVVGANLSLIVTEAVDQNIRTWVGATVTPVIFQPGTSSLLTNQPTYLEYVWLIQEGTDPIEIFAWGNTAVVPDRVGAQIMAAIRYHNDYGYSVETTMQLDQIDTNQLWYGFCTAKGNPYTIVEAP